MNAQIGRRRSESTSVSQLSAPWLPSVVKDPNQTPLVQTIPMSTILRQRGGIAFIDECLHGAPEDGRPLARKCKPMHQLAGGFPAAASRRIPPQSYQQSKFRASLSCEDMAMRRREVIAFCGAAAAAALPRVAHAQARRRLGVLTTANDLQWGRRKARFS